MAHGYTQAAAVSARLAAIVFMLYDSQCELKSILHAYSSN